MPSVPCLRCGALGPGSYCPAHDPRRSHGWRVSGGRAATFRRRTLKRTGGRCARCGSTQGVQAHHPYREAKVGIPLCAACHQDAHHG